MTLQLRFLATKFVFDMDPKLMEVFHEHPGADFVTVLGFVGSWGKLSHIVVSGIGTAWLIPMSDVSVDESPDVWDAELPEGRPDPQAPMLPFEIVTFRYVGYDREFIDDMVRLLKPDWWKNMHTEIKEGGGVVRSE